MTGPSLSCSLKDVYEPLFRNLWRCTTPSDFRNNETYLIDCVCWRCSASHFLASRRGVYFQLRTEDLSILEEDDLHENSEMSAVELCIHLATRPDVDFHGEMVEVDEHIAGVRTPHEEDAARIGEETRSFLRFFRMDDGDDESDGGPEVDEDGKPVDNAAPKKVVDKEVDRRRQSPCGDAGDNEEEEDTIPFPSVLYSQAVGCWRFDWTCRM